MDNIDIGPRPSAVRYPELLADHVLWDVSVRELCDLHRQTTAGSFARVAAINEWKRRMSRRVELMTP